MLDAKGRVSVPASFRNDCSASGFDGIVVWPSLDGQYLEGGDMGLLSYYQSALDEMAPFDAAREALEIVIFGESQKLGFDSTGRVSLPKAFRDYAHLDGSVTFVGRGRKFEIWNTEAHQARLADVRATAREGRKLLRAPKNGAAS